jgi:hypothetical protein
MDTSKDASCKETRYLGSSNVVGFVDVVERIVETSATGGLFDRFAMSAYSPIQLHSFED